MSKITEGPWALHIGEFDGLPTGCVQGPKGSNAYAPVCMVFGPDAKANGEAIAALRDLIEAAKPIVERTQIKYAETIGGCKMVAIPYHELNALRSALEKANGGGE